ncbi:MAG: hypothetical protein IJY08_00625 [Clostridia bacterium]|nr:hypothetical protein [Clostridia bacterium]
MKRTQQRKRMARVMLKFVRLGLYRGGLDPFDVCRRIEGSSAGKSEAKDLFALWELWRLLRAEGREDELAVFGRVYLQGGRTYSADTEARVLEYARESFCDPRTVYRRLALAERRYERIRKSLGI